MDIKNMPFFARFLEAQEVEQVDGAGRMHTMKYPSDGEEGGPIHTMKYPSDGEEGGPVHTMKFPSDGDELSNI